MGNRGDMVFKVEIEGGVVVVGTSGWVVGCRCGAGAGAVQVARLGMVDEEVNNVRDLRG